MLITSFPPEGTPSRATWENEFALGVGAAIRDQAASGRRRLQASLVAAFDSSRVEVVGATGLLAHGRGSSVVLFKINLPSVAAGNVAAQPLEEDVVRILYEVAANSAWGPTINNLGPDSYDDLGDDVTTLELALAAVQASRPPPPPPPPVVVQEDDDYTWAMVVVVLMALGGGAAILLMMKKKNNPGARAGRESDYGDDQPLNSGGGANAAYKDPPGRPSPRFDSRGDGYGSVGRSQYGGAYGGGGGTPRRAPSVAGSYASTGRHELVMTGRMNAV